MARLGDISYSLYLVQFVPLAILKMNDVPRGWFFTVMMVTISLVLAELTFRFVEMPVA